MSLGTIVTGEDVTQQMLEQLQTWVPGKFAEIVRRKTGGTYASVAREYPMPRSWQKLPDSTEDVFKAGNDQFPMIAVVTPGLDGRPRRDGDGNYLATWIVNVLLMVRAQSWAQTSEHIKLYAAAVRLAGAQHLPGVDGMWRPSWRDEQYAAGDSRRGRTLGFGIVRFDVTVDNVLDDFRGPAEPPVAPEYPDPEDFVMDEGVVTGLPEHPALD